MAGIGAGVAAAVISCPTELIKCRLQAQTGARPISPATPALPLTAALAGSTPGAVQLVNQVSLVIALSKCMFHVAFCPPALHEQLQYILASHSRLSFNNVIFEQR